MIAEAASAIFESWRRKPRDFDLLEKSVVRCRKQVSREKDPPIQDVINSNITPILIEIMRTCATSHPDITLEAIWIITNIASGSSAQTQYVIDIGALPVLKQLLANPKTDIVEQSVWCLGNIAGDSIISRDMIISLKISDSLIEFSSTSQPIILRRNTMWLISSLCRQQPKPAIESMSPYLQVIAASLKQGKAEDREVLCEALWALSNISEISVDDRQVIFDTPSLVDHLVRALLLDDDVGHLIATAASRAIGNLLRGTEVQLQAMCDAGAITALGNMLLSRRSTQAYQPLSVFASLVALDPPRLDVLRQIFDQLIVLMSGPRLADRSARGCEELFLDGIRRLSRDQLMELMVGIPLPLALSLLVPYSIVTVRARVALDCLISKVGMKACVEFVVRSKDERYNAIRSRDTIDALMSATNDGPDPSGWVTLLIAHGCKASPTSMARIRVREIDVITILVSRSVVSRIRHPTVWLPKDLWRSFVEFYVAPWTVSNSNHVEPSDDEDENSDDE